MSVEKLDSANQAQSAKLAQRRQELENTENGLIVQKNRIESDRKKIIESELDKTNDALVTISREGEKQVDFLKKINSERVSTLNQNVQKNYQSLAETTAEQIRNLDAEALKKVSEHRVSSMEKLSFAQAQTEDPFYRLSSFAAQISEKEQEYQVKIPIPAYEAKNLFVSSDNKTLKLSLARSFADAENTAPNTKTRTSNYQTIMQSIELPGAFDAKKIRREYADGSLTITLPKV